MPSQPPASSATAKVEHHSAPRHTASHGSRGDSNLVKLALRGLPIPLLIMAIVGGFVMVAMARWDTWTGQSVIQETDNAYVRAEITRLASRVAGAIHTVTVNDYQRVRAGDLLVEIDPSDYEAQVAQSEASAASAQAVLDNLSNQLALQQATIVQAEAQLTSAIAREVQARQERGRQTSLMQSTFGTRQKVEAAVADHAKAEGDLSASKAAVEAQHRQLDVLSGTRSQRTADLRVAQAALNAARLRLSYTRVTAPFDGVVGERQVQPGDYANIGSSLIAVLPLPDIYITANYKETQLTRVKPGQPVEVTVDTFPGEVLHGQVERLSPASGSQFSLLPPDNATGNFTKVVQRIPIRITLNRHQPLLEQLRPGMSVTTRIDTAAAAGQDDQPPRERASQ